ncbi:AEC family transporter [Pelosinus sp. sgz500959]|uniref:AEC family transporter n=1 Tax=Pelosinus sp. sgz500959 TaxID=3242472 RepID=UPI00366F1C4D
MTEVLLKAMAFVSIIILGYTLKRIGFFMPNDYKMISKIVMNLTLPAAVITGFANFQMDISLIYVVLLGLLCNVFMVSLGFWAGAKNDDNKAFYMLNFSGYNIGCFTLPFVQNFLGPFGVVATCMFDSGNSIMCTGGTYAAAASVVGVGEKGHAGMRLIKTLFSSVPFTTYIAMLLLSLLGIHFPVAVNSLISIIAGANSFLAMLMIGMMIEIDLEPKHLKQAAFILSVRYLLASIFAVIFYFYTPFSLEVRQVLVLVIFAPISALVPVFTEKCKGNTALSSFTNSISILLSITIMTILLVVMKVG